MQKSSPKLLKVELWIFFLSHRGHDTNEDGLGYKKKKIKKN